MRSRVRARVLRKSSTEPEKRLWWHLRHRIVPEHGHFRRQVPIGTYVVDFCHLGSKLIIEVDGNQHGFELNAASDRERDLFLERQGYQVLRFSNREVMNHIDEVLDTIRSALSPPPCGEGGPEGAGWGSQSPGAKTRQREKAVLSPDAPAHPVAPPPPLPLPTRGREEAAPGSLLDAAGGHPRLSPPPCGEGGPEGVGWGSQSRSETARGVSSDRIAKEQSPSPGRTTPTPTPPRKGEGKSSAGISRSQALAALRRAFTEAGLAEAALDARLLLLGALGIDGTTLVVRPDETLTPEQAVRLEEFAGRRLAREPVARILGEREFWGLPFALSPETLVPRPETETVVETVLKLFPNRSAPLTLLDLGTGSGCLLVALLHERSKAFGIGIDRSSGALVAARRNAERNGVLSRAAFMRGDWASAVRGRFDVIVSNPPYIRTDVIASLDADVREHDPRFALDGGRDGLDAYRAILAEAGRLLTPDGLLALEIGYDQEAELRSLAPLSGLEVLRVAPDLSGHPRCVALKRTRS